VPLEIPLGALDEQLPFCELHRVHDRTDAMAALLFGAPARVLGVDRSPRVWIGDFGTATAGVIQ
jgi:hypothetical protein